MDQVKLDLTVAMDSFMLDLVAAMDRVKLDLVKEVNNSFSREELHGSLTK